MQYKMRDLAVGQQVLVRHEGTGEIVDLDADEGGSVYVRIDGDGVVVAAAVQQIEAVIS